jgi:beta-N-acetylhexosaminidase
VLALKASRGLAGYPLPDTPEPDWEANQKLADAIGSQAVTLYKDEGGLVPLPPDVKNVLVVGPGDEWELYPMLEAALGERGISTQFVHYPPPWEGPVQAEELLESIPAEARKHDMVLLFSWQAHLNRLDSGDTWQADLVNRLNETGTPLAVVAIESPTDILEFPDIGTYLVMFGSTFGQEEALVDALTGRAEPSGKNPLPGLLP